MKLECKFEKVCKYVLDGVTVQSEVQMSRVTDEVIAINMIKATKNDAIFYGASDFYLNGPPELVSP